MTTIVLFNLQIFEDSIMNDLQLLAEVGSKIKKIRTEKKLSQNDLAMLCNFEKASMSRIEAGKTNVTLLTLKKISDALKVRVLDLLSDGVATDGIAGDDQP